MNKILTIKSNAIFLAIVLVAGTITMLSPSFMRDAQALQQQEDYYYDEMDDYERPQSYGNDNYESREYPSYQKDYKQSYDKDSNKYQKDSNKYQKDSSSAIIKKINCNNINVNLNGLDINATAASGNGYTNDGAVEAASLMENGNANNGGYGERNNNYAQRGNDFTFVCINNNNNTVVEEDETPIPPVEDECAEDIEACFEEFLIEETLLALETALESQAGLTVEINGEDITLRSYADICLLLEGLTFDEISNVISTIISEATGIIVILPFDLIACIAEALGIPIVVPIP